MYLIETHDKHTGWWYDGACELSIPECAYTDRESAIATIATLRTWSPDWACARYRIVDVTLDADGQIADRHVVVDEDDDDMPSRPFTCLLSSPVTVEAIAPDSDDVHIYRGVATAATQDDLDIEVANLIHDLSRTARQDGNVVTAWTVIDPLTED